MRTNSLDVLSRLSVVVPSRLLERITAYRGEPGVLAEAASVVLLRDGAAGLETYLLHRHSRMSFAASMVVFPGGRIDPADGTGPDRFRRCGVRETAEETGVRLDPRLLAPWAHWITPEVEPRRYDTHFFVAELPDGQQAADISGETESAAWTTPVDALRAADDGAIGLMPPTLSILLELAGLDSVLRVLAASVGRVIRPVLPAIESTEDGWRFRYPGRGEPDPGSG